MAKTTVRQSILFVNNLADQDEMNKIIIYILISIPYILKWSYRIDIGTYIRKYSAADIIRASYMVFISNLS